jgi:hypothetical protein
MQRSNRNVGTATLIAALVLAVAAPASAGYGTWTHPISTDDGVPERVAMASAPDELDGALERLARRSTTSTAYDGAVERLAARLPQQLVGAPAVALSTRCGDGPLQAE